MTKISFKEEAGNFKNGFSVITEDGLALLDSAQEKADANGTKYIRLSFKNEKGARLNSAQYVGGQNISTEAYERQLKFHMRILWALGLKDEAFELDLEASKADTAGKLAKAYQGFVGSPIMLIVETEPEINDEGKEVSYTRLKGVNAPATA